MKPSNFIEKIDEDDIQSVKKLLKFYRPLRFYCKETYTNLKENLMITDNEDLQNLIFDIVNPNSPDHKFKIYRRLSDIGNNTVMLDILDNVLQSIKKYPMYGEDYYKILYDAFFDNKSKDENEQQLMRNVGMARSTYYKKRKEAIEAYTILLAMILEQKKAS